MQNTAVNLNVSQVFKSAWDSIHKVKGPFWTIMLVIALILLAVQLIFTFGFKLGLENSPVVFTYLLKPIINNIAIAAFLPGALMVVIKRTRHETIDSKTGFQYFNRFPHAIVTMIVLTFLTNIVIYFSHLPAISQPDPRVHLVISLIAGIISLIIYTFLSLSIPLIADKSYSVWQALSQSVDLIGRQWFKVLVVLLGGYLCLLLSSLPMIIGLLVHNELVFLLGIAVFLIALIWMVPFIFLLQAEVYVRLTTQP